MYPYISISHVHMVVRGLKQERITADFQNSLNSPHSMKHLLQFLWFYAGKNLKLHSEIVAHFKFKRSQWLISCISNIFVAKALGQISWDLDSISCPVVKLLGGGDLVFQFILTFPEFIKIYSVFSELEDYVVIIPIMYS